MPNVVGSRCYAIRRNTVAIGVQWVSNGGEYIQWRANDSSIVGWRLGNVFSPGVGSIGFNGQTPTLKSSSPKFAPGVGSISFVGQAVGNGTRVMQPGVGSITFAGKAPTATTPLHVINVPTGSIVAAGLLPALSRKTFYQPAQGTISFNGQIPGGWRVTWARMKIG